jgi:Domain of unknown function (DUF4430)
MRAPAAKRACLSAVLLASLVLAGCGVGSAPTAVQVLVTREFGSRVLSRSGSLKAVDNETVMGLLMAHDAVGTASEGHLVQSIDGLSGSERAGEPLDWFYYVNGVEAPKGATKTDVYPGDHIWWDLHDWSQAQEIPAVVGSFPEPFANGADGKRWPVRIECATASEHACATVTERLRALGVPAAISAIGSGAAPETLRVMVAPWRELEGTVAQNLEHGPNISGIYARFSARGASMALLSPAGQTAQTLGAGAGLVAATRQGEHVETEAPVWVITGTDEAGVNRAAAALDQATLENHFAVAVVPGRAIGLPEVSP